MQLTGFVRYDGTPTIQDQLSNTEHIVIPIGTVKDYPPSKTNTTPDHFINNDITNFDSDQEDLMSVSEGAEPMPEASSQKCTPDPSDNIRSRGQARRMIHALQDSVSQHSFYGNKEMHFMANKSIINDPMEVEGRFIRYHEEHLSLQEKMHHPIAFHAEMVGDIMYFYQALQQLMLESL